MSDVLNKKTLKMQYSVDTPQYSKDKWIINPDKTVMTTVLKKYWKVDEDILREMTQDEKDEYEFNTNSSVFFIDSHTLQTGIDGCIYSEDNNAILNPIIPDGGIEYGIVVSGKLVAMDEDERAQYDYTHKSTVYLITEKELLTSQNGIDFELDSNAIINPDMPEGINGAIDIETKFTEVVDDIIVMMSETMINAIKEEESTAKALEDATTESTKVLKEREKNVASEIANVYTIADEMSMVRKLITGESSVTDADIIEWFAVIADAKLKYPKP